MTSWFQVLRRVAASLALVCALATAGCTGDRSLSQTARFDAGTSGNDGLILVGMRVAQEPTAHSWLAGEVTYHPKYEVRFSALRPNGTLGRVNRQINICESTRTLFNGAMSDCVPSRMQYRLIAVPAGQYTLNGIEYQMDRTRIDTSFVKPASTSRSSIFESTSTGDPVRDPAESFPVGAGEIVYVGDLNFYFEPHVISARLAVTRNDAAAQRALSSYHGVSGRMVSRSVKGSGGQAGT